MSITLAKVLSYAPPINIVMFSSTDDLATITTTTNYMVEAYNQNPFATHDLIIIAYNGGAGFFSVVVDENINITTQQLFAL